MVGLDWMVADKDSLTVELIKLVHMCTSVQLLSTQRCATSDKNTLRSYLVGVITHLEMKIYEQK